MPSRHVCAVRAALLLCLLMACVPASANIAGVAETADDNALYCGFLPNGHTFKCRWPWTYCSVYSHDLLIRDTAPSCKLTGLSESFMLCLAGMAALCAMAFVWLGCKDGVEPPSPRVHHHAVLSRANSISRRV
eukprot:TRINITY_DN19597_c0_g1_i1.p2 TRINITY_DN19597_c0_g1~~TRINITY_DN19597_c0_g1_i1.p2  ORF type:complete len:133 (+),score=27.19 TRINITY_DN19597_c0_g1_i1:192-590(+)